jgi:hypothetical protein
LTRVIATDHVITAVTLAIMTNEVVATVTVTRAVFTQVVAVIPRISGSRICSTISTSDEATAQGKEDLAAIRPGELSGEGIKGSSVHGIASGLAGL